MTELARVLDRAELDASDGPHGKMSITLAAAQLGEEVEVVVPSRLACARCDGGGCDGCGRSGALRIERDEADRKARFILPNEADDAFRVRLIEPLGEGAGLEQLTIDVRLEGRRKSALVKVGAAPLALRTPGIELRSVVMAVAVAIAAAIAFAASR